MIFRLDQVAKEFGVQLLFREVSGQCVAGDRIGLIGRNGSGKTTLFDLIEGKLAPDQGRVLRSSRLRISRIPQIPVFQEGNSLLQEALTVFEELAALQVEMARLESQMATEDAAPLDEIAALYGSLQARFEREGGYEYRSKTEAVLMGLGFNRESLDAPWRQLSGGQRNRLLVAKTLLKPADLLLLDEPTNHLDLEAILWLTDYLTSWKAAFLLISHDRRFLDQVTSGTWELEGQRLHRYPSSYTRSRRLRQERRERERKEIEKQREWKARTEEFIRRNIAGQKTKQAQSRRRQLARTEWLEESREDLLQVRLRIQESRRGGALSFRLARAAVGYPSKTLLRNLDLTVARGDRIGLIGGNGSGKSTLLKTLVGEVPLLAGDLQWGANNDLCYSAQDPQLGNAGTVYDCLRELDGRCSDEELRSYAALFLFRGDDIYKPLSALSGGERSRLSLACLIRQPANVLILDEPTNHLDIQSREALEEMLSNYEGTLVVASHDLYFLQRVINRYCLAREGTLVELDRLERLDEFYAKADSPSAPAPPSPALETQSERPPPGISKNELRKRQDGVRQLEEAVGRLEREKSEIEESLQRPGQGFVVLEELSRRHQEVESQLAELYQRWEAQAKSLAEAEARV